MTCTTCGAELRPGAMFCGDCGSRVLAAQTPPLPPLIYPVAELQATVPVEPLARPQTLDPFTPHPAAPAGAVPRFLPLERDLPGPTDVPGADFDETVVAPRRAAWTITPPDGVPHPIRSATLIGRAPQRPASHPDVDVLPLADSTKSLSKSHAVLEPVGDSLFIEDIGSTNGVVVIDEDGTQSELAPGRRFPLAAGARLELGDYLLVVGRG